MELVIDKVKYSKGRTTIESHEGIIEDPEESDSKTSKSPPTDKFIKALQDLNVDVREDLRIKRRQQPHHSNRTVAELFKRRHGSGRSRRFGSCQGARRRW